MDLDPKFMNFRRYSWKTKLFQRPSEVEVVLRSFLGCLVGP